METVWTPERKTAALASLAKWQGTIHRDRIAIPGVGIDCIQLVLEIFIDSGIIPRRSITGYSTQEGMFHQSDRIRRSFCACMDMVEIHPDAPQFGDVAVFQTGTRSGHVAFYTEGHVWHALARRSVTVSQYIIWRSKIQTLLRLQSIGFKAEPKIL